MNNRGSVAPLVIVILFSVVAIGIFISSYSGDIKDYYNGLTISDSYSKTVKFGDAIGNPKLNYVSYIIGEIPQYLIDWTNKYSAVIIVVSMFVILMLIFSDILFLFGSFSKEWISYFIGFVLTLIAANMKFITYITMFGFAISAGLGSLSVVVAVGMPFLLFLAFHFGLFGNVMQFVTRRKRASDFKTHVDELSEGVKAAKAFGKAVRSDDS